jgi:hypothetical protein
MRGYRPLFATQLQLLQQLLANILLREGIFICTVHLVAVAMAQLSFSVLQWQDAHAFKAATTFGERIGRLFTAGCSALL